MRSLPAPATTRRTAIGGAVTGLLALAGCDAAGPEPDAGPGPSKGSSAGSPTRSVPPADPDSALLDRVIDELDELGRLVAEATRARPSLAPRLAGWAELHRAHRAVLPDREPSVARTRLRGTPGQVLEHVLRREQTGRDRLAGWAVAADSGVLARLLASMSAGIAARLAAEAGAARP